MLLKFISKENFIGIVEFFKRIAAGGFGTKTKIKLTQVINFVHYSK